MDKEIFLNHVKDHKMTVEVDYGVNRSILFSKEKDSDRLFRLTTWNYHLCISGDMGCFVFSRSPDMFRFFRDDELKTKLGYWAEKLKADSIFGGGHKKFDPESAKQHVVDYFLTPLREDRDLEEFKKIREELESNDLLSNLDQHEFISAARGCDLIDGSDFWDGFSGEKGTVYYIWCCYAIVWGIQQYDKYKKRLTTTPFE